MRITLDQLIAALEEQKAAGVPGDTLVGIPERDNNGKPGIVKLDIQPYVSALAKDEHAKGWTLCRTVTRGGVPVVVIS